MLALWGTLCRGTCLHLTPLPSWRWDKGSQRQHRRRPRPRPHPSMRTGCHCFPRALKMAGITQAPCQARRALLSGCSGTAGSVPSAGLQGEMPPCHGSRRHRKRTPAARGAASNSDMDASLDGSMTVWPSHSQTTLSFVRPAYDSPSDTLRLDLFHILLQILHK